MNKIHKISFLIVFVFQALALYCVEITISNNVNGLLHTRIDKTLHSQVIKLTVEGDLDARDFKFMRDSLILLETVDLKNTQVLFYQGDQGTERESATYLANTLPQNGFSFTPANGIPTGKPSLNQVIMPLSITKIGAQSFANCTNLQTVVYPNTVLTVDEQAFSECSSLKTIPSKADVFAANCFQNCIALEGLLNLPAELKSLGVSTFDGCANITKVVFNSDLSIIPEYSFFNCILLNEVNFLKSINAISNDAFAGCEAIRSVTCMQSVPPILDINSFADIRSSCIVNVNEPYKQAYMNSSWAGFQFSILAGISASDKSKDVKIAYAVDGIELITPFNSSYTIYDASGRIVQIGNTETGIVKLSITSNAVYFIRLNNSKSIRLFLRGR